MKKIFAVLAATATLASCREAGTAVQSRPSATGTADAKAVRFDTTFLKIAGARTYPHTYTGNLVIGETKKVSVPVQIDWTTIDQAGCPQVAAVQVYQLNVNDRRTTLTVKAIRDGVCKPNPRPAGSTRAATFAGSAYLKLTGEAREIRRTTSTTFTINGLGYHDELSPDSLTASVQ